MTHSVFQTAAVEDDQLRVELVFPPAMYYALVHNRVSIVRHLRIENLAEEPTTGVEVVIQLIGPDGSLADPWRAQVPNIGGGRSAAWNDFHDFVPNMSVLKNADESFPVTYRLTVLRENGIQVVLNAPSRVLAYNEWLNSPALFDSVAAFVQPNTKTVGDVLRAATTLLRQETGSGSLEGYQSGPKRAAEIGAALYEALRGYGISYASLPFSFEENGQRIRTTGDVLRDRLGNCIDLSVTYTACLEAAGLHPLIWIIDGHAFAGFFLHEDRLPEIVSLEPAQMINVVESTKALAVELTGLGPEAGSLDFAEATRRGRANLRGTAALRGMVDIHLAHRSGIRPLPSADVDRHEPAEDAARPTPAPQGFTLPAELEDAGAFDHEENLEVRAAETTAPPRVTAWRRALLDLSLRNPLLKLPTRGKGLDLHVPAGSLAQLDDMVHAAKPVHIVAQDAISGIQELSGVRRAQDLPDDMLVEELTKDHRVYASVTQAGYQTRMRGLQRDARTLEQETGSNYLYLTLGSLVHPTASGEAHAPLFLLPVRIEGGAGRKPYVMVIDGNELAAPNYCLVQWLRVKHGVQIAELQDPITDQHGIDITASFRAIRKALVDNRLSYRIDESASLRLLEFSTFQMWRDLTDHWEIFQQNPVIRHLIESSGRPMAEPADVASVTVDETTLHLPIAADGSQMRAAVLAARGQSFVLEGPPGTGKSQTITNLIAHAVRSGKTVLFVAEKQAALDVVKNRLTRIGLEDFCLDLHGRKQTLRGIHQQLKAALEHKPDHDPHGERATHAGYRARVAALSRHPRQVHDENESGFSAWSAYQATLAHGEGVSAVVHGAFHTQPERVRTAAEQASRELPAIARSVGLRARHPWMISGRRDLTGLDSEALATVARDLERVRGEFGRCPEELRAQISALPHPSSLSSALEVLHLASSGQLPTRSRTLLTREPGWDNAVATICQTVVDLQRQHSSTLSMFRSDLFTAASFAELRGMAEAAVAGLFGKKKRRLDLVEALRPYLVSAAPFDEAIVLATFQAVDAARQAATAVAEQVRAVPGLELPTSWWPLHQGAAQVIEQVHRTLVASRTLLDRRPQLWSAIAATGSATPLDQITRMVQVWGRWLELLGTTDDEYARWTGAEGWTRCWDRDGGRWNADLAENGLRPLDRWRALLKCTDALYQAGLTEFRRQLFDGEIPVDEIEIAFLRGAARSALRERLAATGLEFFDAGAHEHQVEEYLDLASAIRQQLPSGLATELVARRSQAVSRFPARAGELVRRLNSRKDRLSFRQACAAEPEVVTALTPCFMMSPASVANFLEPGTVQFDIVVFDEASQIRVAQAVGAMGRGRSVVVVGDSKQMPPTSVMQTTQRDNGDENSSVPEDLDSILAECVESGLPRETLTWHYRSTDESLITFSNIHYYENQLASLPSPGGDPTSGIRWRRVDGQYDRGASRTNQIEAAAVVAEIGELLANPTTADRSIGVVTFNIQQRDLLLNLAEASGDQRIQAALAREDEALFVKNLENVQGDERDIILFSLAFSKNPETGELPLNFGPLAQQGGERRLNVAITRARTQITVFSSFDPADINLARTSSIGTRHLRAYLELAADQSRISGATTHGGGRADRVTGELADELREHGYEVEVDYGLSHFKADLAVRTPGSSRWQVAVLFDGPEWGARPTVADRDGAPRLLESVMNWSTVARVWLPQWISDRETVLTRIIEALEAANALEQAEATEASASISAVSAPGLPASETVKLATDSAGFAAAPPVWPAAEDNSVTPTTTMSPMRSLTNADASVGTTHSTEVPFVPFVPFVIGTREQIDTLADNTEVQQRVSECLAAVIAAEGPVEVERLSRLVHRQFGLRRVAADRRDLLLRHLPAGYRMTSGSGTSYAWPQHLEPESWRGFRKTEDGPERAFQEISPEEMLNAMCQAHETAGGIDRDELHRATLLLLGYRRKTAGIEQTLREIHDRGVSAGRLPV